MPRGVTPLSKDIYALHMTIFSICVVIGIIVFGILIYSLIMHRKSRGAVAAKFHHNTKLEIVWAIIPFLILIAMAIPASIVIFKINDVPPDTTLTIKITGYQWKWHYDYLDQGLSYFSNLSTPTAQLQGKQLKDKWYLLEVDKPVVVPINENIRFLITSNDVIHSWWVPTLGIKKDAIPGFIHESWARIEKPGIYRGQCAELCGAFHGFMPIVVVAVTQDAFKTWVKTQQKQASLSAASATEKFTYAQLMKLGEAAYNKYCSPCHQVTGLGIPPLYPAMKGDSVAVGKPIARHIDTVLNGVAGTAMQAFGPQLTDVELASIITYERNAWGNNTGDMVQPADVQKERQRLQVHPEQSAGVKKQK
jgi:cytochrome c oxidase subunit 2